MTVGLGIIGCGNVFPAYMRGLAQYDEISVVRCSDIILERAEAVARSGSASRAGATTRCSSPTTRSRSSSTSLPSPSTSVSRAARSPPASTSTRRRCSR